MPRAVLWTWTAAVCAFLIAPAFIVVPLSLSTSEFLQFPPPGWTTAWYEVLFADPTWTDALVRSLQVAAGAIVLAVVIGTAAAYAITRAPGRVVRRLETVVLLPMIVPLVIFAAGAYLVAIELGVLGDIWTLMVAHALVALPYVVVNVAAALRTVDGRLELVARTLGASPWRAFRHVTLPLIAPAVGGAALLAGVLSLDETVIALFLSPDTAPTLPVKMYASVQLELDPVMPAAATVMLGVTLLVGALGLALWLLARRRLRGGGPLGADGAVGR